MCVSKRNKCPIKIKTHNFCCSQTVRIISNSDGDKTLTNHVACFLLALICTVHSGPFSELARINSHITWKWCKTSPRDQGRIPCQCKEKKRNELPKEIRPNSDRPLGPRFGARSHGSPAGPGRSERKCGEPASRPRCTDRQDAPGRHVTASTAVASHR